MVNGLKICIAAIVFLIAMQPVLGATLVVYQTEPCVTGDAYYNNIQEAINNASSGDRIIVCPGTYYEVLTIDEDKYNLTIEGRGKPTISALNNPNSNVVTIHGNDITIRGFIIRDAYGDDSNVYGIDVSVYGIWSTKSCNIEDVEIRNITAVNGYRAVGIDISSFSALIEEESEDITIENVKIRDIYAGEDGLAFGIIASVVDSITIRNYEIKNLTGWWSHAIRLEICSNITVDNGVIEDLKSTYEYVVGIGILESYGYGYVRNFSIHNLNAPISIGVWYALSANVEIRDGKIWDLQGESYGIIDGVNDRFGKMPTISRSAEIEGTDAEIQAFTSGSLIENVEIFNCFCGIFLGESDGNEIKNCYIHDNEHGILLYESSSNTIKRNVIENNIGILPHGDSGIHIESGSYNEIHENCFINNEPQAYDNGSNNYWDRNYWDPPIDVIPGSAGSKDNDPLPHCPCFPAKVPTLTPIGLVALIGLISTAALINIKRNG